MSTKITIYKITGELVATYNDVEVLTSIMARALQFRYVENRGGTMVSRTITTTLPYLMADEFVVPDNVVVP